MFCMDFNDHFLSALEWNATYNNVHAGNILVFPMLERRLLENLSEELSSFTCCRFLDSLGNLITGGHDKLVSFEVAKQWGNLKISVQKLFLSIWTCVIF